jgi:phosphatidylglycerophosphate synthase
MKQLVDEYTRSLKLQEAEEWPDMLFFRPLAFVFVKAIYRTPITPNGVSLLSLIAGLASAWYFSIGTAHALLWGGIWLAVANTLDCADGQLARIQQSGTMLGRIIDGFIDYIIGVAAFVGLGVGLAGQGVPAWPLVVAAGISIALHASFFDRYQRLYIGHARGARPDGESERDMYQKEIEAISRSAMGILRITLIRLYLRYLRLQDAGKSKLPEPQVDSREYVVANRMMIRSWTLLGPSTTRSLLIVCAALGDIPRFLWLVVAVQNILLIVNVMMQKQVDARLSPDRA